MSTRATTRRLAGSLVAVLLALAGCAALPAAGPVTAVDAVAPQDDSVALIAYGPTPGASATQIVQGFLRAVAAGGGDEFAVAREYLVGPVAQTWNPRTQVRVYSARDEVTYSQAENGAVRTSVVAAGSVDAGGRYTEAAPDTMIELDFTLARGSDGQWRIVDLDDGILVSPAVFDSQYGRHHLYFLSPDAEVLVPETRWYPERNAASLVVRHLLEGPSPWLSGAVVSSLPTGTRLVDDSVTVADGVAQVELSAEALSADLVARSRMLTQLQESLRSVRAVQSVEVTVGGSQLPTPTTSPSLARNPYLTSNAVVVSGEELFRFTGSELVPFGVPWTGEDPRLPALPYGDAPGQAVVLDGPDRLVALPTEQEPALVLATGDDLVAPSIDRLGWTWTTPRVSDGTVRALQSSGLQAVVDASWLDGASVLSLRISRDGTRAVVVWESDDVSHADVAAVLRNPDGTPRALGEPVRIGEPLTGASVAAWVDEVTVAVLGTSDGEAAPSVHLVMVGGPTTDLPAVEGATRVTAATGDRTLMIGTEDGQLYERNGAGWALAATEVYDPAYPG